MIKVKVDYNCEMLSIEEGENSLFYGNFWDFNRPGDIVALLQNLGHEVEVVEQDYEEWD